MGGIDLTPMVYSPAIPILTLLVLTLYGPMVEVKKAERIKRNRGLWVSINGGPEALNSKPLEPKPLAPNF